MNIIVCYKLTPDPEDLEFLPDGSLSIERAEWTIGSFDLNAIEAAVQAAEATAGKVTALSIGPAPVSNSKLKKDLLSRGPDELVLVADNALQDADTHTTAQVLAAAIRKIGLPDLVVCGEGSADLYFQQVGVQLGELLDLPNVNAVARIQPGDGSIVVDRSLENEVEVLEVPLPAVVSVTSDINVPRLPTMKDILKASKKTVTEWTLADLPEVAGIQPHTQILKASKPPEAQRKRMMLPGTAEEMVQALVTHLSKEGLI
jgi:electron transfer flavoprotein beta subunit